jgi:hypothetical protein
VTLREGTPTGSWGGKTHAVDPDGNYGRTTGLGDALCGVSVYISPKNEWAPEINGVVIPGHCLTCVRRWRSLVKG